MQLSPTKLQVFFSVPLYSVWKPCIKAAEPVFGIGWSMNPAVISINITWKFYTFSVSAALGSARLEILNSKKQGSMLT